MVVPVLGRMSDSDDEIRATASNTFAALVKMIPLEVRALCFDVRFAYNRFRLVYLTLLVSPTSS